MTLTRVWTPTGNYSSGGTKRLIVVHTTEGFTGANGAYDCAVYFQGKVGASSQVCIDNNRGKIWEGVNRHNSSWTQCNFNSVAVSAEQCGYASWSRDYWLANRENELRNTAEWIAEEAAFFGIPIRALTAGEAQSGGKGICHHRDLGSSGCGHSDCGDGYPLDQVIQWAKGGDTPGTETIDMTAAIAFDSQNRPHRARVNGERQIKYMAPGGGWVVIDEASRVKTGVGIAVDNNGRVVIIYDNDAGDTCQYELSNANDKTWGWSKLGW